MRAPDLQIRIAVTGVGIREEVWEAISTSRDGIGKLSRFPGEAFPTDLAAEAIEDLTGMLPDDGRALRRMSRSDLLGVIAVGEALKQSTENAPLSLDRAIVSSGTSTGGLLEGERYFFDRRERGRRKTRASLVLQQPTSGPSDAIANVFKTGGGVVSNATACASAGAAIGMAADFLRSGHADVAIAGGTDALCRLTYSGFNVLQAVDPAPCSPFGASRQGITLGEGAGYLVLERWDDAVARGATILAELAGYGATCDAHHPTAPAEDGRGAEAAMRAAMAEGGIAADEVQYVNAHGTGTRLNDSAETRAIMSAVGSNVPVSSSKSFFGHTLGAAGGIEAVIAVLALINQVAPPTLRLATAADDCTLDYIPNTARTLSMTNILSNTFGFGGSNVSLLFRSAPGDS
jgi:3-oxoacyl-[acyl-carrier-protein] synthase II